MLVPGHQTVPQEQKQNKTQKKISTKLQKKQIQMKVLT